MNKKNVFYAFLIIFFSIEISLFLKNILIVKEFQKNTPHFFIAGIHEKYSQLFIPPKISAKSALAVGVGNKEKILFEKNANQVMPIASLTKLMTALVSLDVYQLSLKTIISKQAISQEEDIGKLKQGERLNVKDLMYIMLIESSNDAAFALGEIKGIKKFVHLMNLKSKEFDLKNTKFLNVTGLDINDKPSNLSTAYDLIRIGKEVLKKPFILNVLSKKEYPLYLEDSSLHHILRNTNKLLEERGVIAGKTGWTETAGGCLLLILKCRQPKTYIISVVLNSKDRFKDMKKIIRYANYKYKCN